MAYTDDEALERANARLERKRLGLDDGADSERTQELKAVTRERRDDDTRSSRAIDDDDYERFREQQARKRTRSNRWSQRARRLFIGEEGSFFWAFEQMVEWLKVAAESINSQLNRMQSRDTDNAGTGRADESGAVRMNNRSRGRHAADD